MSSNISRIKILLLADVNSPHTTKWSNSLNDLGFEVALFSLGRCKNNYCELDINDKHLFNLDLPYELQQGPEISIAKFRYLYALKILKKIITNYSPDILHAHYASSYGLLGALSNFRPYVISVWGSDVLSFPNQSFVHKKILKFNLKRADQILATSNFLAKRTNEYTHKQIGITPFGVDVDKFIPTETKGPFNKKDIVIGTIKSLEKTYGIDTLINAFSIVRNKFKDLPLKLLIIGSGTEEINLKKLAEEKIGKSDCIFTGLINHSLIQNYHNMIDIPVFLSKQESFGVSILEAMACCKPVIVSTAGGLQEIVDDGQNGYIISPNNPLEAANAIEKLINNPELRIMFGKNGREKVLTFYDWGKNVDLMINVYKDILKNNN